MKKATLITNGAYAVRNFNAGHLTVVETEGYYDSLRLGPKKIDFFFAESLERAIGSYEKGEADFVLKCGEQEGSVVAHRPEMLVLAVNQMSSLSEPVRQALSLSLDRNSLAALSALDLAGAEGLVPEGISTLSGNLFRQVNGPVTPCDDVSVAKNREKAKIAVDALNRGGFDINDRLGVVTLLYESGAVNSRVALQVQKQWQEQLGITVTPIAVASDEMLEALESGAFTIAMMSVSDESNTASGYLAHYASDSYENYGQHHSNAYDILLRAAAVSDSAEARDAYLADAERLLCM